MRHKIGFGVNGYDSGTWSCRQMDHNSRLLASWKRPESSFFVVSIAAAIKFATILIGRRERQDEGRRHDDS